VVGDELSEILFIDEDRLVLSQNDCNNIVSWVFNVTKFPIFNQIGYFSLGTSSGQSNFTQV